MSGPSNAEVMEAITVLSEQVTRIADALQKQQDRKEYHSEYYKKRKVAKLQREAEEKRLPNKDKNCLDGPRDRRLPHATWALKLKEFVDRGLSPYNFLTWLAWTWNHATFRHAPVTRSGGYNHVFCGMSGDKPIRTKRSDRDFTGHMRITSFTKPSQIDTFQNALWWNWGWQVLAMTISEVQGESWYQRLGDTWHKPMQVMQGGIGMYETRGVMFDQNERDLVKASKAYGMVRPTLEMGWGACLRGLFCKVEPFTVAK